MKKLICFILAVILIFSSASASFNAVISSAAEKNELPDNYGFAEDFGAMMQKENTIEYSNSEYGLCRLIVKSSKPVETLNAINCISSFDGITVLEFPDSESTEKAFDYYSGLETVDYVETDKLVNMLSAVTTSVTGNYLSWGPEFINLPAFNSSLEAMNVTRAETKVAVLDTGVQTDHERLAGRVIPGKINVSTSGKRNDASDDNGHGTQTAGAIIDSTCDSVKVIPYKVMDCYGNGTTIGAAAAIICAIKDGVDVINMSFGFYENSPTLELAVKKAYQAGILLVAAAGNNATDSPCYPADYEEVIKVSAVNEQGTIANFSNYGNVDIAAPGVNIYTTNFQNGYIKATGTSIAAPFVSALAAEIHSTIPASSPEELAQILYNNCYQPQVTGMEDYYGNGILYAPEADPNGNYHSDKTAKVSFSHKTAVYSEPFELSMFCETPDSEIYYSTDFNFPSKFDKESFRYDAPVTISENTVLTAVAYSENRFRSVFTTFYAIVAPYAPEEEFTITADGTVTSYSGNMQNLSVPDIINGITVTAIGNEVFKDSDICSVILPETTVSIGESAFEGCVGLNVVKGVGITKVGNRAFYGCTNILNIRLGALSEIGEYSFAQVKKNTYRIDGSTFTLDLLGVTQIPDGAFYDSALRAFEAARINSVGTDSFKGCNALASVIIHRVSKLPNAVFKDCTSLKYAHIDGLLTVPREAFSGCGSLKHISVPDASLINANAFLNCTELKVADVPNVTMLFGTAFKNCASLTHLYLPSMTSFDPSVSSTNIPEMPPNLVFFSAPKLQKTAISTFLRCNSTIRFIYLDSVTTLAEDTFRACENISYVHLPKLENITVEGFTNCLKIDYINLQNLVNAASLPNNSGILLSSKFTSCTDTDVKNLRILGTAGSYAEQFAKDNSFEFRPIPFIYRDIPECISETSETVTIGCVGFGLSYQWFYATGRDMSDAKAIESATESSYTFTPDDAKGYYYCEITQNDNGLVSTVRTRIAVKDDMPADYSLYNTAVSIASAYKLNNYYNSEALAQALTTDVSGLRSIEQDIVDNQTALIYEAIKGLVIKTPKSFHASCKATELRFLESTTIVPEVYPDGAVYKKIIFESSDKSVIRVTQKGKVTCIGDGNADVKVTLIKNDGSKLSLEKNFTCKLSKFEKVISFIFRLFILIYIGN